MSGISWDYAEHISKCFRDIFCPLKTARNFARQKCAERGEKPHRKACLRRTPRGLFAFLFAQAAAQLAARKAVRAYYYKGNAEYLSHVEEYGVFELLLHFLDELDEEAEREYRRKAPAEEESRAHLLPVRPVEQQAYEEHRYVGQRLVQLPGVARHGVAVGCKDEAPRHVGGLAHYLGVEQVAQAYEARRQGSANAHVVKNAHGVDLVLAYVEPQRHEHAEHAAVRRKPLVARAPPSFERLLHGQNHLQGVGEEVPRLVKQAVPKARSGQYADEHVQEQRFELFLGYALLPVKALHNQVAEEQAGAPAQAVPPYFPSQNAERYGVGIPVYE